MSVKNLTSKSFDEFVKSGKGVIDFYADWCNPCKIMSPIVEDISGKIKDIKFGKVDVDKESELTQRFQIMSVPTLLFFKNKGQVDRIVGVLSKEELIKRIGAISK